MKYNDFALLCDREWQAGPPFGDVTALNLTDESAAELAADVFAGAYAASAAAKAFGPEPGSSATVSVPPLRNLITCSDVTVTRGAESDTATVSYGTFAWAPEPRTVAIGQAESAPA